MSAAGTGKRSSILRRQQQQQHRIDRCCSSRCGKILFIMTLFMIGGGSCLTSVSAFHIAPSSFAPTSLLPITVRSNVPYMTRISSLSSQQRYRLKLLQWVLASNNNQWEDDIIISPDLSDYFSKQKQQQQQQQQQQQTGAILPSAVVDKGNIAVAKKSSDSPSQTTSNTALSSSSLLSVDNIDIADIMDTADGSNNVKEIVVALQAAIENGSKNKNMLSDIMTSIQQLQRIQQHWNIQNSKYNSDEDDDKLILMKNPKKRSSNNGNTKKKNAGMAITASTATKSAVMITQQSSLSYSMILPRLKETTTSDEISYRLLWVGSDDTISAFGTGLHKVPLARLQEVFITISIPSSSNRKLKESKNSKNNRFQMTTTEVIRILGPFPNIKNTLQGTCTVSGEPNAKEEQWDITWNSMIDGTGKELIGNSNDDVRRVPTLHMLYGDEQIIVASMRQPERTPSSTATNDEKMLDTLPSPAVESILIFVRDTEMEDKLTALRVL